MDEDAMSDRSSAQEQLQAAFPTLVRADSTDKRTIEYRVDASRLPDIARYLHDKLRGRLALLFAIEHRAGADRHDVRYLFALESNQPWIMLTVALPGQERLFPSITPSVHAAQWYEREVRDLFGLIPHGHPDLRRLIRH